MKVIISLSAILLCSCGDFQGKNPHSYIPEKYSSEVNVEMAEADAREGFFRGDKRLLGVSGYSLEVPGTDLSIEEVESKYGINEIKSTGDVISGNVTDEHNAKSKRYAEIYNKTILKLSVSAN